MYNYVDLIWIVDKILVLALALLVSFLVVYAAVKDYFWKKRALALSAIKRNVYESVLAKKEIDASVLSRVDPGGFLDIATNRNREVVFFNESEQALFKDCFITDKKIKELEHIALSLGSKWRRIEAILSLGYAGVKASTNILAKAVRNKDDDIAYFSIIALGQIKTRDSAKVLLECLKTKPFARLKIVSLLESFPPDISDEVVKLFKNKSQDVRFWSLKLISKFKPQDYSEQIEKLVADRIEEVRAVACECLGQTKKEDSRGVLLACLKDESWLVRASAAKALENMLGDKSIPEVVFLINDGSLSVIESLKAVITTHIDASMPYIRNFLSGQDGVAKRICIEALEESGYVVKLFKKILDGSAHEREDAINFLESMVGAQARFGLGTALKAFDRSSQKTILENIKNANQQLAAYIERQANSSK